MRILVLFAPLLLLIACGGADPDVPPTGDSARVVAKANADVEAATAEAGK